jgi:hypothetical protein
MKSSDLEKELNAIRIELYEQIKDMTSEEQTIFFKNMVNDGFARHGIKARYADAPIVQQQV